MHAESLAILGHLQLLTDRIVHHYSTLRSQQPLDRTWILALTVLVKRLGNRSALLNLLISDMAICEQQNSLAVCSPASDSIVGMHASKLDCDDDVDAVFASGNSMDDQLLYRVFVRIVQRAEKSHPAEPGSTSKLSTWLNQLRLLGGGVFDQMVLNHLHLFFRTVGDGSKQSSAITALVASGCLALDAVASCAREIASTSAAALACQLLLDPDAASISLSSLERYRYRLAQTLYRRERIETMIPLLCMACGNASFSIDDIRVTDLLVAYATNHAAEVERAVRQSCQNTAIRANASRLNLAMIKRGMPQLTANQAVDPRCIVKLADPLSMQMCAGALQYFYHTQASKGADADGMVKDVMVDAIISGSDVWPRMLEAVNGSVRRSLHDWARERLLQATSRLAEFDDDLGAQEMNDRCLNVIDATKAATTGQEDTIALSALAERLRELERQFTELGFVATADATRSQSLVYVLHVALHICGLYIRSSEAKSEVCRQARSNLLAALCALLVHPIVRTQAIGEYVFDVASSLADDLPDTALVAVAQSIGATKAIDPQVRSILGSLSATADAWLALASQVQLQGSQQQRALAKHASQQGQPTGRSGIPGPVATGTQQQIQQQRAWPYIGVNRAPVEMKTTPFPLRRWEIMPDPTPVMGENDTSLSLGLFGARKV